MNIACPILYFVAIVLPCGIHSIILLFLFWILLEFYRPSQMFYPWYKILYNAGRHDQNGLF